MSTEPPESGARRAALQVFVGEWDEQVLLPDIPPGRVVSEWALDGTYLIQRADIPQPEFPDSISIIAYDAETDAYTMHYFDSRGIVRIYEMGLRDGRWTLLRDGRWTLLRAKPDFTPLEFAQRFEGIFSADGDTIDATWNTSHDGGETWELDFGLTFTRVK